ncbi:MAG: FAD-dependent oxidoreductase [Clostridia bacterium]|jgi:hypothetical protein|nr:FAD-dependent oxidoreductase [Clostridia bacterium]
MRKIIIAVVLLGILFAAAIPTVQTERYDAVIYGGGFAGCAAANSAASLAPGKKILLIIPEPVNLPGGLGTIGGQNFTDIRYWRERLVTQGSFGLWFNQAGQFYNTEDMAGIIKKDLDRHPGLRIIYGHDLKDVKVKKGQGISRLKLVPVEKNSEGLLEWKSGQLLVRGAVYLDASDDGRLSRLAGVPLAVGRQDWPTRYLDSEEITTGVYRQQAATLMFKVRGVKTPSEPAQVGEWFFSRDHNGSWGLAGGQETWSSDAVVTAFNEKYAPSGFSIKPINAAQNGSGSDEWWVNTLLIYHVDARAQSRDKGTAHYPKDTLPGRRAVDEAWTAARGFLQNPEFMEALRRFRVRADGQVYGFAEAELVLDEQGLPAVGEVLYLRESVHSLLAEKIPRTENENSAFAVTMAEAQKAGPNSSAGADAENYPDRIGLGYYMMDINAYQPEDLKKSGDYVWPVTGIVRPDWREGGGEPENPVYLPYRMLLAAGVDNLLIPGYAAGCSSFAWAELRVLPNQAVFGDAAGVAAARALQYEEKLADFGPEQIGWVQEKLKGMSARIDKEL